MSKDSDSLRGPEIVFRMLLGDRALSFKSPRCVQVADGDGQSIGSIHRLRRFGKFQQSRDHMLHLLLFGASVPDYRGLDGERRIFGNFESGGRSCQHCHSAHLAEFEG